MDGPRVPERDFTERYGVLAVDRAALDARCIWRETPLRDVGIDGQIEHVLPSGVVSGRMIAVQVKSGTSFFSRADGHSVPFTPELKHRAYWARHPLPVIIVLHDERGRSHRVGRCAPSSGPSHDYPVRSLISSTQLGVLAALASDGPLPGRTSVKRGHSR